jgi:hypothetical protein
MTLSIMQSFVMISADYAECHHTECHYAKWHVANGRDTSVEKELDLASILNIIT